MATKYLIYTGIFLLLGACSNKAIYYNPDQKRSIYFNWDLSKYVSNVIPDTVFSVLQFMKRRRWNIISR